MSNIDKQALNQEKIEWLNKLADMEYCKSNPGHWLMSLKDTNMLAKLALRSVALLDELKETQEENQRMRVAMRMQHATLGNPRKLFTCSSCEAEGLDEQPESKCHCMGDDAHWIESVIYQPEKPNGPTA